MAYQDFLLDKRVVHRNIEKGLLEKESLDKHLANLTDVADNSIACSLDEAPKPAEAEEAAPVVETLVETTATEED